MATRRHAQNGRLYADITSDGTGSAQPVAALNAWSVSFATDKVEVTGFEDGSKVYVSGKPDAQGTFAGFLDVDSDQLYNAAVGGQARKFYLYPDRNNDASKYWFGTAIFDFQVQGSTSSGVEVSGSWAAASTVGRIWS